jgi:hypothetical protein
VGTLTGLVSTALEALGAAGARQEWKIHEGSRGGHLSPPAPCSHVWPLIHCDQCPCGRRTDSPGKPCEDGDQD